MKTTKYPDIRLEITTLKKWTKAYSKIKAPKGYRLPWFWELAKIIQTHPEFFKCNKYRYYLSAQTDDDIKTDSVRGLGRCRDGNWDADWYDDLDFFDEDCRVVFIRDLEEKQ